MSELYDVHFDGQKGYDIFSRYGVSEKAVRKQFEKDYPHLKIKSVKPRKGRKS